MSAGRPTVATWVAVVGAGAAGTLSRYRQRYYFYDEWGMIERVHRSGSRWAAAFDGFNGHLVAGDYLVYRAQLSLSGLGDHHVVYACFTASLVVLHLAASFLFRRGGVPPVAAVLAGAVVAYFGPGSQDMVFQFQQAFDLALGAALFAAALTFGRPRPGTVAAGAAALTVAVLWDSGVAAPGLLFCGLLAAARWPWRQAAAMLAPPAALLVAWSTGAGTGPSFEASLPRQLRVVARLLLGGTGGLVGGATVAGAVVIVVVGGAAAVEALRRRLDRSATQLLVAGGTTAVVAAGLIARQRAGLLGGSLTDFNRYLQVVGIWMAFALLPPAWSMLRSRLPVRHLGRAADGLAVGCVVAFVLGLAPMRSYNRTFEAWNRQTRAGVAEVVAILDEGCPVGTAPDPAGRPLGALGPQISVQLVDDLRTAGLLDLPDPGVRRPEILGLVCAPTVDPGGDAPTR